MGSSSEGEQRGFLAPSDRRVNDRPDAIGSVTVIHGCMFSGKTTELLRRFEQYPPSAVRAVKPAIDTRYSHTHIVSHGGKSCPGIAVLSLAELLPLARPPVRVLAIDEAHFFDSGLVEVVRRLCRERIDVLITALQPDSWGRPFGVTDALCAIADEAVPLTARCSRCGATADRTQRLTPIVDGRMVGGVGDYEPRCRRCWRPPPEPAPRRAGIRE
jgi:thymidine kinase